ncbi:MAG: hypothetical protein IPM98_06820 [Lewinellaceae bacterium]|nr:hypothetical protein [Lewinellaceae bacterium]
MKDEELENLKSAWNAAGEQPALSRDQLLALIRQRTQNIFSKMHRNLLFETIVGILGMAAWAFVVPRMAPGNDEAYLAALQMALMTALPLGGYYYVGFRNLGRGLAPDSRLISALQQTIIYWDQILHLYFWGGVALLPSFFLSFVWFLNCVPGETFFKITNLMTWVEVLSWVAGLSAITILFVWISIKISYAKHVAELKACLRELEEAA